jgi:hypothetical protein
MNREFFARRLYAICDRFDDPNFDITHFSEKIMAAFIAFGSETPDNLHCAEIIEYGRATLPQNPHLILHGFKLKDKPIFVQHVLGVLETIPIPVEVREAYSEFEVVQQADFQLQEMEWAAAMLMAKKIVEAFSPRSWKRRESLWNIPMQQFAQRLCSLYDRFDDPDFDAANYNTKIMKAFMEFDWTNPGNQNCLATIEFGSIPLTDPPGTKFGFRIIGKPIFIVDILNNIESPPIPEKVRETFPALLDEEWSALLRMATMFVAAFGPTSRNKPLVG